MHRTIITFESVRMVIKAEQCLSGLGIVCRVIPIPEHISSECGMCIETNDDAYGLVHEILTTNQIAHQIVFTP